MSKEKTLFMHMIVYKNNKKQSKRDTVVLNLLCFLCR